jgi:hypothetical protein
LNNPKNLTMNRVYSVAALLLIGGSLSAQRVANAPLRTFNKVNAQEPALAEHHSSSTQLRDAQEVVFSEDFANGFAGNNGIGPWTTAGANGNIWAYTHTGPVGAYSNVSQIIASPTVANGFAIFESDSANTNWADTTIVASPIAWVGSLVSPIMDLTGYPAVTVNFAQRMRYCCSDDTPGHFLEVSTDGGTNWTRFPTENGILDNADPGTVNMSINIAGALSGQPLDNVQIRFTQDGANGITHYHWQIDDIQIVSLSANDMKITNAAESTWNFDTANTFDSIPYSIFPISQLRGRALNLTAFNNGSNAANNVQAHFTTTDGYDQTVDLGTMAPGATQTAFAPLWTPTASLGDHSVYFTLSSDETDDDMANNYDTAMVKVSDFIYARDLGARTGGYNDNDQGDAFRLGNKFYIANDVTLYGIDVAFSAVSATDIELDAQLLDAGVSGYPPIAETAYHTLMANELSPLGTGNFVSFIFDTPVELSAGTDYLAVVQHFGGANVLIGVSGTSPAQTSNFYRASNDTWYYVTSTPMVRLNFTQNIGIGEANTHNGVGLGQNYPNPANGGNTRIDFSLDQSAPVTLVLRDISGKLVQTLVDGTMGQGVHHVDVNTADLGAGVYFYTLTTGKNTSTKRMTVVR